MKEDKILPRIKEYQLAFRAMDIGMSEENAYKVSKIVEYMLNTESPDIKGLCSLNREILERLGHKYESISDRILPNNSEHYENEVEYKPEGIGPDWGTAPPGWANYWAIDKDGYSYWYEYEPILDTIMWDIQKYQDCKTKFTGKFDATNWQNSLQKRPK